ncbi:DDE-type integrase/transposase/recombinase [Microvirga sp. BT688]|nr:DDE-type integrase/transposase/recombinase [Microvirga sp.]
MRVGGRWKYLFRAVDKHGRLIAFMLSDRRNTNAAYRFLRKAIQVMSHSPPSSITTDKLASYPKAIRIRRKLFVSEFQLLLPGFRDGGWRVQGQAF